jgi:hypothetical protein
MRFEEECVFALFDVSELEAVLAGKRRGGMFGIVDEEAPRVTVVNYTHAGGDEHKWKHHGTAVSTRNQTHPHHGKPRAGGGHHDTESESAGRHGHGDQPAPTTYDRDDHRYWKAKYAHRHDDDAEAGSKSNMNMNLNLNLNFKHGRPVASKITTEVKRKERAANGQTSRHISGEELDRQLADD